MPARAGNNDAGACIAHSSRAWRRQMSRPLLVGSCKNATAKGPTSLSEQRKRAIRLPRWSHCRETARAPIALFRALLSDPAGAALRAGCCFHLGKLALLTGRSDDARTLLKSCLAASPNHAAAAGLLRGLENATQDACLPS